MKCEHCGHELDTASLQAKQGSQTRCPQCGEDTRVAYTVLDELKDPVGHVVKDLKYANPFLTGLWLLLMIPLVVGVFAYTLDRGLKEPELRVLLFVPILMILLILFYFGRRVLKNRTTD